MTELELIEQLQELIDREFICQSASQWELWFCSSKEGWMFKNVH